MVTRVRPLYAGTNGRQPPAQALTFCVIARSRAPRGDVAIPRRSEFGQPWHATRSLRRAPGGALLAMTGQSNRPSLLSGRDQSCLLEAGTPEGTRASRRCRSTQELVDDREVMVVVLSGEEADVHQA